MTQSKKEKLSVSFKKDKPETGLMAANFMLQGVTIKVNKKPMGYIYAPNRQENWWSIGIQIIKDEKYTNNNPNCSWMWVRFEEKFETEAEARQFAKDNIERWNQKFNFYYSDN